MTVNDAWPDHRPGPHGHESAQFAGQNELLRQQHICSSQIGRPENPGFPALPKPTAHFVEWYHHSRCGVPFLALKTLRAGGHDARKSRLYCGMEGDRPTELNRRPNRMATGELCNNRGNGRRCPGAEPATRTYSARSARFHLDVLRFQSESDRVGQASRVQS